MIDIKEGGLPVGAIPENFNQDTFFKASTNLSVCLEKDGQRDKAMKVLEKLRSYQGQTSEDADSRLNINLAVMH